MKKERSGRARTVPSRLGSSVESAGVPVISETGSPSDIVRADLSDTTSACATSVTDPPDRRHLPPSASHNNSSAQSASSTTASNSALKKTVNLLSPEILTNWYANRKKENLYGQRRNSISNLFFNPVQDSKKLSSPVIGLPQDEDKLRKSMLNLDEILRGEGVLTNHRSGKGIKRTESEKLSRGQTEEKLKVIEAEAI